MLSTYAIRRRSAFAVALIAATTLAACGDSTGPEEEEEPEVAAVVVSSSAGGTATLPISGTQTGTLTLRANQANTLTIRFLGANGSDEPVVASSAGDFEVRVLQGTSSTTNLLTSASTTYPFTGTIQPTATGTAVYRVQLFHRGEGHVELEVPLSATVTQ